MAWRYGLAASLPPMVWRLLFGRLLWRNGVAPTLLANSLAPWSDAMIWRHGWATFLAPFLLAPWSGARWEILWRHGLAAFLAPRRRHGLAASRLAAFSGAVPLGAMVWRRGLQPIKASILNGPSHFFKIRFHKFYHRLLSFRSKRCRSSYGSSSSAKMQNCPHEEARAVQGTTSTLPRTNALSSARPPPSKLTLR